MAFRVARTLIDFAVLVFFLSAYAQAAPLEPPKTMGALQLVHALRGKEALQAIDRLHGKGLAGTDGYIAHCTGEARPRRSRAGAAPRLEAGAPNDLTQSETN